jgi:hypothetical protein
MNLRARIVVPSLLLLGFVAALLLVLKFRAGVAVSVLCFLTGLVAALAGASFRCHGY